MSHELNDKSQYGRDAHYLGNNNVKRDGVAEQWDEHKLREYKKCMDSPVYFALNYLKVIHLDKGLVPFKLYPYQEKMFDHFTSNRFSIVLACRQSGKSISSVAYLLWFALFHPEKTIAVLANKGATAREMLARVTLMLENLPFFLQPGCKALNKGSIEFSNNSRIIAAATSGSSIRGMSVNLLFLDEFAFVENAAEFYTSTYPVVSSGKDTKVIITSTANGLGNTYHKIWEGAVQGVNEYKPFRVDWFDVPGRDEEWKKQTIANTSQLQFDQEFGNCLGGNSKVVIEYKNKYYHVELGTLYDCIQTNNFEQLSRCELERVFVLYKITNNINGKYYIGKTSIDIWNKGYMGSGTAIKSSIKKYGKVNFTRELISYHISEEDVYLSEKLYLTELYTEEMCYNIAPGGKGVGCGEAHPNFGKHWTDEQNRKRSKSLKGQIRTKEQIKNYKKAWTNERKKIQAARMMSSEGTTKGHKLSDKHKQKISDSSTNKIKFSVDGVVYDSVKEVMEKFKLSRPAVYNRGRSKNFPTWKFV